VPGDVFEEDPSRLHLSDDPSNVWPEVPLVGIAFALPCLAKRLAGVSGEDGVDAASQLASVECDDIVPDGRWREISCALRCDDCSPGILFPFDECSSVIAGLGEHEAEVKPASSSTQAKAVLWSGRKTHAIHPATLARTASILP